MNAPSNDPEDSDTLREKIIGLGEHSQRKSYYPKLQQQIRNLKRAEEELRQSYAGLEIKVLERTAELVNTNEILRESEERYRTITENAQDAIFTIDEDVAIILVNNAAEHIFGYSRSEMKGKPLTMLMPERMRQACLTAIKKYAETGRRRMSWGGIELPGLRKDGREIPLEMSFGEFSRSGKRFFTGIVRDISRHKKLEEEMRLANEKLSSVLNTITEGYYALDSSWRFIELNKEAERLLGPAGEIIGELYWEKFPQAVGGEIERQYRLAVRERRAVHFEALSQITGTWIEFHAYPRDDRLEVYFTDITDRKIMEEEIRHMAQHDALTGLPNRRLFVDIAGVELAQARRQKRRLAVLFLDLDRFKEVNDSFGHDTGDRLLQEVAARLKVAVRASDTVARIGGDEFNVLLSNITRPDDITEIAEKIAESINKPIIIGERELSVTTSIGISIYPDDSHEVEDLLKYADSAMYHAKETGSNKYQFYNPSINVRATERMKLERSLRQTIKRGELSVLYQPEIDVKSRKIGYAEALVRWNHPERGVLQPGEFIQLAEETGFITQIDEWVLRTVCMQAAAWKKAGLENFCVTVNLSSRQFQSLELVEMISTVLKETGMPPGCLDLEVTESAAMNDIERSAAQLRELREMGVHITIDNFGTGYSSLSHLRKLQIERLKIDKSFVREIASNADDRAIVQAVTSMAHKMGIRTVAEGVETEEQLKFVRAAECDEAQGFLFGRPVPAEEFRELVVHSSQFEFHDCTPASRSRSFP